MTAVTRRPGLLRNMIRSLHNVDSEAYVKNICVARDDIGSEFCLAVIVRSCRERRVCPSFCVCHRRTSPLCGLVGRDVCVPHFVSLTGVPALCAVL